MAQADLTPHLAFCSLTCSWTDGGQGLHPDWLQELPHPDPVLWVRPAAGVAPGTARHRSSFQHVLATSGPALGEVQSRTVNKGHAVLGALWQCSRERSGKRSVAVSDVLTPGGCVGDLQDGRCSVQLGSPSDLLHDSLLGRDSLRTSTHYCRHDHRHYQSFCCRRSKDKVPAFRHLRFGFKSLMSITKSL